MWLEQLQDADVSKRCTAARKLGDLGDITALPQMIEACADPHGYVRLALVESMAQLGPAAVDPLLSALAHHPEPMVRRSVAKSLAILAAGTSIAPLIHTLKFDPDLVTRNAAAGALCRIGVQAVDPLIQLLTDPDEYVSGAAIWALGSIGPAALLTLLTYIKDGNPQVRSGVVQALGSMGTDEVVPALQTALQDADAGVRASAARSVGNGRYKVCIPQLEMLLTDPDRQVRRDAAIALGEVEADHALPTLLSALSDPDVELRKAVVMALKRLPSPQTTQALKDLATVDPEESVRTLARMTLQFINS
ncbi:HEAT repeat domain-containing protein [Candidatus Cyanaurora vandensis]|uniref:HEAT repeat domain-containing protein n=1 Tax=Candidatus Cyanaurora vandensis TaxID=2714958 RepID=UPI00257FD582|nr:HEAT repeat domain-containing protein [Candidatus Cyanaurora vandensis]